LKLSTENASSNNGNETPNTELQQVETINYSISSNLESSLQKSLEKGDNNESLYYKFK
jgi:hypothetical protein